MTCTVLILHLWPLTCDLPFVPAATKSKCMGQENKWNDQHCQNVFGVRTNSLKQYPTIRNNDLIEECFVALFLSFGQWDIFLSSFIGPLSPAISIREELWQWEIYFLSRLKLFCSLCTLAVYYGCKIKFSLPLFPNIFFFSLLYVIVQICPSTEKGFITINYYILNILL